MRLLFTRNNLPGSHLIRWGLMSDCSHLIMCFGDGPNALCVESTLLGGVHPIWLKRVLSHHEIVHIVDLDVSESTTQSIYDEISKNMALSSWDWKGALFWSFTVFFNKIFRIPVAKTNKWADRNAYYCTEVLNAMDWLFEAYDIKIPGIKEQFIRPHEAYLAAMKLPIAKEGNLSLAEFGK